MTWTVSTQPLKQAAQSLLLLSTVWQLLDKMCACILIILVTHSLLPCLLVYRGLEALAGAGIQLPSSMCLRRGSVVRFRGTKMYDTPASPYSHSVNR